MTDTQELAIGGESVPAGSRRRVALHVFRDLDDSEVNIQVHVVRGTRPGPTLTLSSMLHGDEWFMVEVVRDILEAVDPATLRGTLLAFPVGNPYAFRQLRRTSREALEYDSADINRVFPGEQTWLSRRIAYALTTEVLAKTTHLIDFHPGPVGSAWMQVMTGRGLAGDLDRQSEEMARAFGVPCIHHSDMVGGHPGPRSLTGYAAVKLGIPSIVTEVGGLGFDRHLERRWRDQNVRGVLGVMQHLGMIDGTPPYADRYLYFDAYSYVRSTTSGYLMPLIEPERLLTEVEEGEPLAKVISAVTFEERETLRAPSKGLLFCVARSYPVQPHNYAYGVADLTDPSTVWK